MTTIDNLSQVTANLACDEIWCQKKILNGANCYRRSLTRRCMVGMVRECPWHWVAWWEGPENGLDIGSENVLDTEVHDGKGQRVSLTWSGLMGLLTVWPPPGPRPPPVAAQMTPLALSAQSPATRQTPRHSTLPPVNTQTQCKDRGQPNTVNIQSN